MNIWQTLKKPILILAPMEDVTDTVFRQIILSCGRPDLFFTEFTNVEGMASVGDTIVSQRLRFSPEEKPLIAQVWGKNPEHYFQAAKRIAQLGFDGIDINMGCPQKVVTKNGCCAAMIKNKPLAHDIITATQQGAGDLPVSVKTRIGYGTIATEEWISFLLTHNLAALTVHGRTAKEMSKVPAHWDEIGKAVTLRNQINPTTLIIGNGDVESRAEAEEKVKTYGVDGVMIGRGIFHNPFLFHPTIKHQDVSLDQMVQVLIHHLELYERVWQGKKHYPIMKKYFKIYISGFEGANDLRAELMETNTPEEALRILSKVLSTARTTYTNQQLTD